MATDPCPVLVYQMGKVASTALCTALGAAGIEAAQTHFLGEPALAAILRRLLSPALNAHFAFHLQGQLDANIVLTRRLVQAQAAVRQRGDPGAKVKVISLAREPLDWYSAELVQNFDGYIAAMQHFCGRSDGDGGDDIGCIGEVHRTLLQTLAGADIAAALRPPFQVSATLNRAFPASSQVALIPYATNLLKPLLWFQRLFQPPTGIDVFAGTHDEVGPGALRFDGAFCEALVIRYEQLADALPALARFVGLRDLKLPRSNVSEDKPAYRLVRSALAGRALPGAVADALYESDYCRLFGYPRRDRF